MPRIDKIENWPASTVTASSTYRHRLLVEDSAHWDSIKPRIKEYFRTAHSDAIRRIKKLTGTSLHPLNKSVKAKDPLAKYPHKLDQAARKGYFGEVFCCLIAES